MKLAWAARSIRARLTGWYAIVLTAMLIVYATATYVAVRHEFLEQLDGQLHDDFETAEGLLTWMPDGRVAWVGDRHLDPDDDEVRIVYEVWSPAGERIHRSGTSAQLPPVASGSDRCEVPVRNCHCKQRALAHVDCDRHRSPATPWC